ncbi:MAG: MerR family transcriptional regulator [Cycloclasticus pugetii]|uniref:MerR family transcriptional regulator n=1 Tax=Cycloclasticus pugetii TaxID=34068 RepID=UPI003A8FCE8C
MKEDHYVEQARMSIGVVERMTGINANTLRMWERRYQLGPSTRSPGGQREYTATDIDHLRLIKKLMDKGMRIGDIAQLPTKTLTSLLLDTGDDSNDIVNKSNPLKTEVVGISLSRYFKTHIKRYPKLAITCSEIEGEEWLSDPDLVDSALGDKDLLILQQSALNKKHIERFKKISEQKIHVVVLYLYSHQEVLEVLEKQGIILLPGNIEPSFIDETVNKVLRLTANLSSLDQSGKAFDISLPNSQPRQFDEQALIDAEALSTKLNCECPPHLTDLIRRLSAFEEYSQTCGAENWKQAAVHACVYSYTNQARYLIEKALRAVLDE